MAGLRKDAGPDAYFVTGTLAGIKGPGRRTVRVLTVRGLQGYADGDLAVLSTFPDLESLTLEKIADVDLAPLAQTGIRGLGLLGASRVDLGALAKLDRLTGLMIAQIADCTVPRCCGWPRRFRASRSSTTGPGCPVSLSRSSPGGSTGPLSAVFGHCS